MRRPPPADVLRFIADGEPLERTLATFPSLRRADLRQLLVEAARLLEDREPAARQATLALTEPSAAVGQGTAPPRRPATQRDAPADRPAAAPRAADGPAARPAAEPGRHRRLRVYSDGAARGNPGPAGAGAVLFDEEGNVVERLGRYLGRQTNNYAEYQGLLLGLHRALELGAREVEVVADSELMIRQLEGRYKVKAANLRPLWEESQDLLSRFDRVRLVHVLRDQNADADEMSNRAIDERM